MLELNAKDLKIYQKNLDGRKKRFQVHRKRGDNTIIFKGKGVAKLKKKNSVSFLSKEEAQAMFSMLSTVKKSVNRYLIKNNFRVKPIEKKYGSVMRNKVLFDSLPVGTQFQYVDVKHCYWRVAYLKGYITEYFYNKVMETPELKLYRNMSLSCIIAGAEVEYHDKGELIAYIKEDVRLYDALYKNILYTVWNIFGKLAFEKIGKENCIGYFTDGIMVFDEDLRKVTTTLARQKWQYRTLLCEKVGHREYVYVDQYVDDSDIRRL